MTEPTRTEVVTLRQALIDAGYRPVSVYTREKRPRGKDWQHTHGMPEFSAEALSTGINTTGLRAVDIDIDDPDDARDALSIVRACLGDAPIRHRLSPRVLLLYAAAEGKPRKKRLELPCLGEGQAVEVLGEGQQCIVHGEHPTGQAYQWPAASPFDTPREELPRITEDQIEAMFATLRQHFPGPAAESVQTDLPGDIPAEPPPSRPRANGADERTAKWARAALENECSRVASAPRGRRNAALNEAAFALGQIVARGGLNESEVRLRLTAAAMACGLAQEGRSAVDATIDSGLKAGAKVPRLAPEPSWNGGHRPNGSAAAIPHDQFWNPWRDPAVVAFPLDTLPDTIRLWCEERALTTGADLSAWPWAALAAIAGLVDHRVTLKPKQYDDYRIRPRLRVMLVGNVSVRKTAVISHVPAILRVRDARDQAAYEDECDRVKAMEGDPDDVPRPRVRVTSDPTAEGLCDLLSHHDGGTTMVRDELSGWIGAMDKYSGGGRGSAQDRGIWLSAHDGGLYIQTRASKNRVVKNLSANIFGAIQPERLKEMGNLDSDGLLQRFIPVLMRPARPDRDEPKDPEVFRAFDALMTGVDAIPETAVFMLEDDARAISAKLGETCITGAQAVVPSPAFGSFVAKLPAVFHALCLLLHMIEVVEGRASITDSVTAATAARADRIVREFVLPHAHRFYDDLAGGGADRQHQAIATVIVRHAERTIKLRQFIRSTRAMRGLSREQVQAVLFPFIAGGWLTPVERGITNNEWRIAPGLVAHFAAEAEAFFAGQVEIGAAILAAANRGEP